MKSIFFLIFMIIGTNANALILPSGNYFHYGSNELYYCFKLEASATPEGDGQFKAILEESGKEIDGYYKIEQNNLNFYVNDQLTSSLEIPNDSLNPRDPILFGTRKNSSDGESYLLLSKFECQPKN